MVQDWTLFTLNIAVKSTLKEMYDAWTKPKKIEQWFLETCQYFNGSQAIEGNQNAGAGCTYVWTWFLYNTSEKGTLTETNGKDFVQFTFAGNCLVDIQLSEKDEYVMVTLTQKNIPTDEKSKFNIRIGCLEGWTFYLANLKSIYEGGLDLRNKIPELKGFNN